MSKEEVAKIVFILESSYPNFKPNDKRALIALWFEFFEEYDYNEVARALKCYIQTNTSAFAPSVGQIIEQIHSLRKSMSGQAELTEGEAWALVRKCTAGNIDFEKLPTEIQKAIGSKKQAEEWGLTPDVNWEVVQSQFLRSYRAVVERKATEDKLPNSIQKLIAEAADKVAIEAQKTEVKQIARADVYSDGEAPRESTPEVHTEWTRLYAEQNGLLREYNKTCV